MALGSNAVDSYNKNISSLARVVESLQYAHIAEELGQISDLSL